MPTIPSQFFLFDMDGTLVDSTAVVEETWTRFAHKFGLDVEEVINFAHGRTCSKTVNHFISDHHLAYTAQREVIEYEETHTAEIIEIPGAYDFVSQLSPDQWAIVTSAGQKLATNRIKAAGLPFPKILISAQDVIRSKPDPQGYLMAAERLGANIQDCIVFEDSQAGIQAGIASGAQTIVIGDNSYFDDKLLRIADFTELHLETPIIAPA